MNAELARLRRRLTAWYAFTFGAILLLLGAGLFLTIRHQLERQLDESLRDAAEELARAARIREREAEATGHVVDALDELHVPGRILYLLDTAGRPIWPDAADTLVRRLARVAADSGMAVEKRETPDKRTLRLFAERFTLDDGRPLIAVAVADRIELESRIAALIAAFGAVAAVALVLVAAGGWFLALKSSAPVERSMEQMRRFMADAAHELRTPITVLRTRAEVALQQPREAGAYVAALRTVEAEGMRLGHIVDDLLMLARADAGERPLSRSRIFLDDVAVDAAEAARVVAEAKGVVLTLDEFEEAPVEGDPALLRQLVMILLDNAVKFTPAGGRVGVRVHAASGRVTLVVTDTGIGLAPEQLPHVFERFWRGDEAHGRDGGGAGLGLAIARWIADAHDAALHLTSSPGAGTTVTFEMLRRDTARRPG